VNVDRDVLFSEARQLERRQYGVRFVVVVDIQPMQQGVSCIRSTSHPRVIGCRRLDRNVFLPRTEDVDLLALTICSVA